MHTFRPVETRERIVGKEGTRPVQGGTTFNPPNCQGVTKAGHRCSAPRAKETMFCIGHLRQNEAG